MNKEFNDKQRQIFYKDLSVKQRYILNKELNVNRDRF